MPGPNYPNYTQLDADQVLQRAFDEANDRLRVDASVTATIAGPFDVSIEADADNIAIRNSTNSNELLINNDGSINTNINGEVSIELDAADGDNVAISDGTDTLSVNTDGSINVVTTYVANLTEQNYFGEVSSVASGVTTATTFRVACMTVVSEGGFTHRGIVRRTSNGTTAKTVGGTGTLVPVLSLRKKTAQVNVPIKIEELQLLMNTIDDGEMVVLINPTLTGASWTDLTGAAQRDVASTALSGGTEVYGSYVRGAGSSPSTTGISSFLETANLILGSNLAGTSDIVTIALRNITSASTAFASLVYREVL